MCDVSSLLQTLAFVANHPLNRGNRLGALGRFIKWQIGSRLVPGDIAVPFAASAHLLVSRGMTAATGNIYTGLFEFEDMAFVMHLLQPDDLFADIGANVGSYTILAGAVAGANVIAAEPAPAAFRRLEINIRLNNLSGRVIAREVGLGAAEFVARISSSEGAMNHILSVGERPRGEYDEVSITTLDKLLFGKAPSLIKIDVEGFETEVIKGGKKTLESNRLLGVIMELNGNGRRYGFSDDDLHETMLDLGFRSYRYAPFERTLAALSGRNMGGSNTLYLRNLPEIESRLNNAPRRIINSRSF
jgi:FkbM family methyltransferase